MFRLFYLCKKDNDEKSCRLFFVNGFIVFFLSMTWKVSTYKTQIKLSEIIYAIFYDFVLAIEISKNIHKFDAFKMTIKTTLRVGVGF